MKTYLSDLIPRIKRFSQELDNITLLTNQHWVVIDELSNSKYVYIFRSNSELLIAQDGRVEKGKWEYLGNNAILIGRKEGSYLFRHGFFDENVLALKVDGKEEYAFLVNENKFGGELNSIEKVFSFLEGKYLNIPILPKTIEITPEKDLKQELEPEKFGYIVLWEKDSYDIIWGTYTEYFIEFFDKIASSVFKGKSSGKYFYTNDTRRIYCNSFEETVLELYEFLKKHNFYI
jgi:hypothetical protein